MHINDAWEYKFVDSFILQNDFNAKKRQLNVLNSHNHFKYCALDLNFQMYGM